MFHVEREPESSSEAPALYVKRNSSTEWCKRKNPIKICHLLVPRGTFERSGALSLLGEPPPRGIVATSGESELDPSKAIHLSS